jgi:hypothetical protein
MKSILLVEPGYRNKYPPLGLMKLSTYHKWRGDRVRFVKGRDPEVQRQRWDRVYVATLFTFFWDETIKTIRYYRGCAPSPSEVFVGGVTATLMSDEIRRELGVTVVSGLLDKPGMLDPDSPYIIDHLVPDYAMLEDTKYAYGIGDAYVGYATRGCPNRCAFCAVSRIEPTFCDYLPLKEQIRGVESVYGPRRNLLLLDNNVLASRQFSKIVADILDLGFEKSARFDGRQRCLDFNQGIDARRLTQAKMKLLAKTAITPFRMAFDDMSMKTIYTSRVMLARDHGILKHSTYVLYNHTDTPKDFYERMRTSALLNEQLGTRISSFPMRYIPLDAKDRTYIGPHWNWQLLRGVQCILLVTRGIVSPHRPFFEAAFGATPEEFLRIALMPEDYIIYRRTHETNGADDWTRLYSRLGKSQRQTFLEIVGKGRVSEDDASRQASSTLRQLLSHYVESRKLRLEEQAASRLEAGRKATEPES